MTDRVLIFANTPWEADALMAVFRNGQARPPTEAELAGKPPLSAAHYFPEQITSSDRHHPARRWARIAKRDGATRVSRCRGLVRL